MKSNYLKIDRGAINLVEETLRLNDITGKILYVSDPFVDKLYGDKVKKQIANVGRLKVEFADYNTIAYAMDIAERCIATDVDCIVGLGGGRALDVCKYAAMSIVLEKYEEDWKKIIPRDNATPHILLLRLFEKYDEKTWTAIKSQTQFHKLTYKFKEELTQKAGTYYKALLN